MHTNVHAYIHTHIHSLYLAFIFHLFVYLHSLVHFLYNYLFITDLNPHLLLMCHAMLERAVQGLPPSLSLLRPLSRSCSLRVSHIICKHIFHHHRSRSKPRLHSLPSLSSRVMCKRAKDTHAFTERSTGNRWKLSVFREVLTIIVLSHVWCCRSRRCGFVQCCLLCIFVPTHSSLFPYVQYLFLSLFLHSFALFSPLVCDTFLLSILVFLHFSPLYSCVFRDLLFTCNVYYFKLFSKADLAA